MSEKEQAAEALVAGEDQVRIATNAKDHFDQRRRVQEMALQSIVRKARAVEGTIRIAQERELAADQKAKAAARRGLLAERALEKAQTKLVEAQNPDPELPVPEEGFGINPEERRLEARYAVEQAQQRLAAAGRAVENATRVRAD